MAHVVIVGAGPGGAVLAYLLARRGVGVTLVERQTDFEREFRGEVLMPSALEAFSQIGLGDAFARVPQVQLDTMELYLFGKRLLRADFPGGFDGVQPSWVSQPALLEMLVEKAGEFPSFRLERGATVRELLSEADRVVGVRADTREGRREFRGDLVVGADGRASIVRRRSSVTVKQDRVPLDIVWCKVPLPSFVRSDPHLRAYLGHGHLLLCAPTPDDRLQLGWVIRKGKFGELRKRGLPEWMDELAGHVSPDLGDHLRRHREETSRPFLLDVVSDRVEPWSTPGMLLIGDAAHTMSPVFAQGLNIAIRDAVVAANELVPVLTSGAGPDALDGAGRRIEEERLPEVVEIKRLQAIPPRFVLSNSWWSAIALRVLPGFLFRRGPPGRIVRSITSGVTDVKLRV